MEGKKSSLVKWLFWFSLAIAVIAVYKILDCFGEIATFLQNLINILMPFVMGILFAYILYIPCRSLENILKKCKLKLISNKSRLLSIVIIYLVAIIIVSFSIKFILPGVSQSVTDLINNLPSYYTNALNIINDAPEDSLLTKINAAEIINSLQQIDFKSMFSIDSIFQYAKGVISFVSSIFNFFVAIIVSFNILLERGRIVKFLKDLSSAIFKHNLYKNIGKYFRKTNDVFFRFLFSQLIDSIVIGVIISIALLFMHVKYAVLLGFMIGLFNLIPFIGAIIAVIIAILITLLTGGLSQAIWVTLVIIILQQIDANIINPKITGNSLEISPILVIFAVTIGGAYFGVLGLFLAVPICTVIKSMIQDFITYKNEIKKPELD